MMKRGLIMGILIFSLFINLVSAGSLVDINLIGKSGAAGRDFIRMTSDASAENDGKSGTYLISAQQDMFTFRSADLNWGAGDISVRNLIANGNVGIGTAPSSILTLKNNYDANSRIGIGALSIGGNQGKEAGWTRWYLGYNMFWNGNYDTGKWKASDKTYRSIFINDNNVLRYIIGMPEGQTEWTTEELRKYTKFSVDSAGNVKANGTICDKNGCIGAESGESSNKVLSINLINYPGDASGRDFIRMISSSKTESDGKPGIYVLSAQNDQLTFRSADLNWGPGDLGIRNVYASGNVGIGTSSPNGKLEVAGGMITFPGATDGGGYLTYFNHVNGKNYIRGTTIIADYGGNVGIGIQDPKAPLHVKGKAIFESDVEVKGKVLAKKVCFEDGTCLDSSSIK